MKISTKQMLGIVGVGLLMLSLGILVALAQQRRDLRKRADTSVSANDGVLDCDPGKDPYNSNSIKVSNNTNQTIDGLRFDVHRCSYKPGIVEKYRGSFICEPTCDANEPNCLVGKWDGDASNQGFKLEPGESKTLTASANECEIIQVDAQNPASGNNDLECHNVQSSDTVPTGDRWPGGIAFGISENSTGYDSSTGTCPEPTTPPPSPTTPPVNTPTVPTGVTVTPTYTPIPTIIGKGGVTPIPTIAPVTPSQATPVPTRPVAGSAHITTLGILGGIGLLIIAALAL